MATDRPKINLNTGDVYIVRFQYRAPKGPYYYKDDEEKKNPFYLTSVYPLLDNGQWGEEHTLFLTNKMYRTVMHNDELANTLKDREVKVWKEGDKSILLFYPANSRTPLPDPNAQGGGDGPPPAPGEQPASTRTPAPQQQAAPLQQEPPQQRNDAPPPQADSGPARSWIVASAFVCAHDMMRAIRCKRPDIRFRDEDRVSLFIELNRKAARNEGVITAHHRQAIDILAEYGRKPRVFKPGEPVPDSLQQQAVDEEGLQYDYTDTQDTQDAPPPPTQTASQGGGDADYPPPSQEMLAYWKGQGLKPGDKDDQGRTVLSEDGLPF